jgi:hypothetical protein
LSVSEDSEWAVTPHCARAAAYSAFSLGFADIHQVPAMLTLELERHVAVDEGKQGVILAHADIGARVELGATLAHDDGACT